MLQNVYVSLGSNLGDRAGYLLLAVRGMLAAGLDVIRLSVSTRRSRLNIQINRPFST
jgi:7,8-dihydro-6-hydroxymethylpterin-pyrophosphokinase